MESGRGRGACGEHRAAIEHGCLVVRRDRKGWTAEGELVEGERRRRRMKMSLLEAARNDISRRNNTQMVNSGDKRVIEGGQITEEGNGRRVGRECAR